METVHNVIRQAIQECKLDEDLAHCMELTINESMINAIQHGNRCDPTKEAKLKISWNGETIEVVVEDQGKGFSLDAVADPTDSGNILKPCGRGVLIIRSFMDEVVVSQSEAGGTRLRMLKHIRGNHRS